MPPQRWPTEFHYVDEGMEQAAATDFVCVNHVIAKPWRQCFAVPPGGALCRPPTRASPAPPPTELLPAAPRELVPAGGAPEELVP